MQSTTTQTAPASSTELLTTEQLMEAWLRSHPIKFGDPILAHTQFPYRNTYFPLGFPVDVATNSPGVLEEAQRSWGAFSQLFHTKPIRLQIAITSGGPHVCPPTPVWRMNGHLAISIADPKNFTVSDFSQGTAIVWATEAALQHGDYFRYCFLEAAAMSNISNRYATAIHAACVALDNSGVLLCGDSGAGKSTLAFACALAGWAYITDDGSYLVHGRNDTFVAGNCQRVRFRPSAEELFPELHGLAVMQRAGVGKPSVEILTNDGKLVATADGAQVQHIVFLNRHRGKHELTGFPRPVARLFMQQRVHCMPYQMDQHMAAIDRLLGLRVYELCYDDLQWAVARLEALVREDRS